MWQCLRSIAACRQRGLRRTLMVSVIWSVPFSEGLNRQAPTSASCMAAMACRLLRFLKFGCRMGRLMTFLALARRFSAAARAFSSRLRMWYHLRARSTPLGSKATDSGVR